MIAPLLRMPSELHRKFGYFLVVPFVVVTIMSAIAITWIPLSSNRTEFVPEQDGYMQRVREAEERFGHPEPIVMVVEVNHPLAPGPVLDRRADESNLLC